MRTRLERPARHGPSSVVAPRSAMRRAPLLLRVLPVLPLFLAAAAAPASAQAFTEGGYTTGSSPMSSAFADLDGDGHGDLVVANYGDDTFRVLLGYGNGAFFPAGTISFPIPYGTQTGAIALLDVNGDGRPDLISPTYYSSGVAVLLGDGSGGFGGPATTSLASAAVSVRVGDFDGDGRDDLLAASPVGSAFYLLRSLGGGAFAAPATIPFSPPGGPPSDAFAIVDLDLNGDLDFVAPLSGATPGFAAWFNNGSGGFGLPFAFATGGSSSTAIAVGDLNSTGAAPAVAVLDSVAQFVRVSTATSVHNYASAGAPTPVSPGVTSIALANVDDYWGADLLTLGNTGGNSKFECFTNFGLPFTHFQTIWGSPGASTMTIADLDANGFVDVVAPISSVNVVSLFENLLGPPSATFLYGDGTAGCSGRIGLSSFSKPLIPFNAWALTTTNAPRNAVGLCIIGDVPEIAGADPFALGAVLHVDLFSSTLLQAFNTKSRD